MAWGEVITEIPSDRLNDSYIRAMRDRRSFGMLTPTELLQGWWTISGGPSQYEEYIPDPGWPI